MAATKAGPRSGIPTSSRFGYAGGSSLKAPSPATTATSIPNGNSVATTAPKSQLAFNSSRKPVSGLLGRTENSSSSEGLQHVGKHNGYLESLPTKADVYIKPPNSTPNSRLNSPVNTSISGLQAPSKDKSVNNSSKLQYSSQLHDLAKRREQSQSPKTVLGDQEPANDTSGQLASLALADKKRHSSDSTANKYKPKQSIPSPLRESNKIDISQHNSALKPRRGNSPHSTLLKQEKTLNHVTDTSSSAFHAPGKYDNRQMLREPAEKNKRLSSSSSGSDDATVPSLGTAFQRIPARAELVKSTGSQQKFIGIPQAFSPPPKVNSDEVDVTNTKSKLKPQHHILPMSSGLQAKSDSNSAHGNQLQRSMLLPTRSNANQNNMLVAPRASSPPHVRPNMLPRVIKMKNSNQTKQQEDSKKDDSHSSDHNANSRSLLNNSVLTEKSSQLVGHSPVTASQSFSNNTTLHQHSASNMQPPVALVKNNLLDEMNDTDSCVSETGSESTAATVVMGKQSSIADLSSLDSSSPSIPESLNSQEDDTLQLSPPLNAEEFPTYFSHDSKFLGKLQNIGFNTGSKENSPTSKSPPQDVATKDHSENECTAYSEEDVVTALDAIASHSDKATTKVPSISASSSNHKVTPQMKSNVEAKSSLLPKPKDMEVTKDQSIKTMSLPTAARYDGLSRFAMKRDKPGKLSERVSPERSTESDDHNVSQQKNSLHGLSEKRERNRTIAFSREFLKSGEDKGVIKPLGTGLKLQPFIRSEQNLSVTAKPDSAQLHSNSKSQALSPPHTSSGLLMPNGSAPKDMKSNLDALRKKILMKKAEGSSDITREKESSVVKSARSDMDHAVSSFKLKSPPRSAFRTPVGASPIQPNTVHKEIKSPVLQPTLSSPTSLVSTSEEDKNSLIANKPMNACDSGHEHSGNPDSATRKSSGDGTKLYTRGRSPSPVETKAEISTVHSSPIKNTESTSNADTSKAQEASSSSKKSMDDLPDNATVNNLTEKHNDVAGSSKGAVGETSTESIGVLQSALLTNHDLPHVLDDVQRVEILNNHQRHCTIPANGPSNDHPPPQMDHSSSVVTRVPDQSLLNNVVIDKVADSVDSMGSHVDSTAVNIHTDIDRSQHVETTLQTEQEATSVTLPQLNAVETAVSGVTIQEDEEDDDEYDEDEDDENDDDGNTDIISNTLKQSDFLADDKSDVLSYVSHVSDRSHTSNFSFRMKPYMPAHLITEGSYLEQRKRESLTGNDRDFLENDHYVMPQHHHLKTSVPKRPNSELEKSSQWFPSDPSLDLRRSSSRSPAYLDRYTPENQFKDSEVCACINNCRIYIYVFDI